MTKFQKLTCALALAGASLAAQADVVLQNLSTSATNISFDIVGTITAQGTGYRFQFGFGHVSDPSLDWISSLSNASSVVASGPSKQGITSVYDLTGSYGETVWTTSSTNWAIGDQIQLHYNLVGNFNLANFHADGLGFQNGFTNGPAIEGANNLLVISQVPEPMTLVLVGLGLIGAAASRRRRA